MEVLEYGQYYHIFNRGNNYENIFELERDYLHFLNLFDIYIGSIADTYSWCLMRNHFHFLIRIKDPDKIGYFDSSQAKNNDHEIKWKTHIKEKSGGDFTSKPTPSMQFKHLFNAYARWFNLRNKRSGSLFEKNFERKWVDNEKYFKTLITYIHNNPVKHGFVEHTLEYPWTSYLSVGSSKPTKLMRDEVMAYFGNTESFTHVHNEQVDEELIEHFIIE